ncbi:MAG: lysine 2,3-aminomutase, partial [Roseomonas sp.]|nr:lysine 2,3-aminomutase [Roseomonas sp.]
MPQPIAQDQSRTLRSPQDLARAGLVALDAVPGLEAVAARYATAITPAIAALINKEDPADPIGLQYIPDLAELITAPHELEDPT